MLASNPMFSQLASSLGTNVGATSMMQTILGFPGVGIAREMQEKAQRIMAHGIEFQQVYAEYQKLKNNMNVRALEILQNKLIALGKGEKKIENMRDLFVIWIDCLEEAHSELVISEAYLDTNARLVKAMMSTRKATQDLTDDMLEGMNIPNRRELNTAYKKIQFLKRQYREIEEELRDLRASTGGADVEHLQDQLAALQAHVEKTLGTVPAVEKRPAASRRKATSGAKESTEKKGA
jgi:class III poly(R)-hydroxyalkanoic acid synthase PhaE subunit